MFFFCKPTFTSLFCLAQIWKRPIMSGVEPLEPMPSHGMPIVCLAVYSFVLFLSWLVVWLPFFIFPNIGNNHPNWLSYFSEGFKPPTSVLVYIFPLVRKELRSHRHPYSQQIVPMKWGAKELLGVSQPSLIDIITICNHVLTNARTLLHRLVKTAAQQELAPWFMSNGRLQCR